MAAGSSLLPLRLQGAKQHSYRIGEVAPAGSGLAQRPPQHSTRTNSRGKSHVTLQPRSRASQCTNLTSAVTSSLQVLPYHGCGRTSSRRHEAKFHWDLECSVCTSPESIMRGSGPQLIDSTEGRVDGRSWIYCRLLEVCVWKLPCHVFSTSLEAIWVAEVTWCAAVGLSRGNDRLRFYWQITWLFCRNQRTVCCYKTALFLRSWAEENLRCGGTSSGPYGLALVCLCCADGLMSIVDKPSCEAALGADTSLNILVLVLPSSQHTSQWTFVLAGYHKRTLYNRSCTVALCRIRRPVPLFVDRVIVVCLAVW